MGSSTWDEPGGQHLHPPINASITEREASQRHAPPDVTHSENIAPPVFLPKKKIELESNQASRAHYQSLGI